MKTLLQNQLPEPECFNTTQEKLVIGFDWFDTLKGYLLYLIKADQVARVFDDVMQKNTADLNRIFKTFCKDKKLCPDNPILALKANLEIHKYILENSKHTQRRGDFLRERIKSLKENLDKWIETDGFEIVGYASFVECSDLILPRIDFTKARADKKPDLAIEWYTKHKILAERAKKNISELEDYMSDLMTLNHSDESQSILEAK